MRPQGVSGEHPDSYSGNDSVPAWDFAPLHPSTLELFLGLGSRSLIQFTDSIGQSQPHSGSAIKQTFTAKAGSILMFNWQYLTDEAVRVDFAFVVLDGNILFLADVSAATHESDTPFLYESGYRTFVVRLANGGTHTIGLSVIDTLDGLVNSGVLLDNIRIVPEPIANFQASIDVGG